MADLAVHDQPIQVFTIAGMRTVQEYTEHYHLERNHQGRDNELIEAPCEEPNMDGAVECQERLGGVLTYYRRAA